MVLNERLPRLFFEILSENNSEIEKYDAVLVDEGQDFRMSWWKCLRKILAENEEMLLVADHTQNLYGTASVWTDEAMTGAGFRGEWAELQVSYRLPGSFISYVVDFAERYIPENERTLPVPRQQQLPLDFRNTWMRWIQITCSTNEKCSEIAANIVLSPNGSEPKKALA